MRKKWDNRSNGFDCQRNSCRDGHGRKIAFCIGHNAYILLRGTIETY